MQSSNEKKSSSSDEDENYNQAITSATNVLDAFTNAMNPMTEMSMLSGLTSALKSYDQESSDTLASLGTNAVKSYVNQFVPTALGQVAKTTDEYERSTTSTKTGVLPKAIDTTKNQFMSKIPGLRQKLPIKTDIWGKDVKQTENVALRALENSVLPWTRKEIASTAVDEALVELYDKTGEGSVLPNGIDKNLTIDGQKYVMTSKEYANYREMYGKISYDLLRSITTSQGYRNMSDNEKKTTVEKVYGYAKEQIKIDYAKQNRLIYEESKLSKTVNELKETKANEANYFEFLALTQDCKKDKEKVEILANTKYSNNTKRIIYENSIGSDDDLYDIMKHTNIDITKYLQYKTQEFVSDKKDDGTLKGKTVSKSKQKKTEQYLNSIQITPDQRLLLYAMNGYSTTASQKNQLVKYVRGLGMNGEEQLKVFDKCGFKVYKNGNIEW